MVKVTGPMFSVSASGTVGKTITFKCGEVVARSKNKVEMDPDDLSFMQLRFQRAAEEWSRTLSGETKNKWALFGIADRFNLLCGHYPYALPFFGLLGVEFLIAAGLGAIMTTNYQLYMSYYLALGENGWLNYPDPPPIGWRPNK